MAVRGVTMTGAGRALAAAGLDVRPLPRSDGGVADLRRAIVRREGPMVFAGLLEGWPARTRWNPETLSRAAGATRVTALLGLPSGGVLLPCDQERYEQECSLSSFLATMRDTPASRPCYLAYTRVDEVFPRSDHDFGGLLGHDGTGTDTRAWIGSAGTRSMLHSDLKDNVFCQIWGSKDVVLAPWTAGPSVYPFPDNLVNSRIDIADPRCGEFPLLRKAVFYAGGVEPGELLFIPRGCWHDFRAQTPSISLNHWFGQPMGAGQYLRLLLRLGPRYWGPTVRDFVRTGVLGQREQTRFFYSPPSTGKRLWDLVTAGNFSRGNDPIND